MTRVEFIVASLLESPVRVRLTHLEPKGPPVWKKPAEIRMVRLQPVDEWTSFWSNGHGAVNVKDRLKREHWDAYLSAMRALNAYLKRESFMVDASGWTLKMPDGYCIVGKGSQGVSFFGSDMSSRERGKEMDNPILPEYENRTWRRGF